MGGSQSRQSAPLPVLPKAINFVQQQAPPPTPNPAAQCATNKINMNDLQRQLNQKQADVESCDPSVKTARTKDALMKENADFIQQARNEYQSLDKSINDGFRAGNELAESVKLLKQFAKEMEDDEKKMSGEITKFEHKERAYRRDFLDNDPTEGVPWHIFGLQTADDKVMLAFWSTSLIMYILLAVIVLGIVMPGATIKKKAIAGSVGVFAMLLMSYLLITYYG